MKLPLAIRRNRCFKFLSSLNLALWLLGVVIVASVAGTLYESSFSAEVAKNYVYGAWWFQIWLALLAINLGAVAFSRMPWKKRHLAFLLTHFGIITILIGAMVGKWFGIEGSVTLFEGQPGTSRLVINEQQLTVSQPDGRAERIFPVKVINRSPSHESPWDIGHYRGLKVELVGHSEQLQQTFEARPVTTGGSPAVKVRLHSTLMNQTVERWLWLGGSEHAELDLELAKVTLNTGRAESVDSASNETAETKEFIFIYEQKPGEQVSRVESGSSSELQILFTRQGGLLQLEIQGQQQRWQHQCRADELPKQWKLAGTEWTLQFSDYWPDFSVKDGVPISLTDEPNNPAALVEITGSSHLAISSSEASSANAAQGENWLKLFPNTNEVGQWSYQLSSRTVTDRQGTIEVGTSIATGWSDWSFTVLEMLPQAHAEYQFHRTDSAVKGGKADKGVTGAKVRLSNGNESAESWVPMGWQVGLLVGKESVQVRYGRKSEALPFVLRLEDFELKRNPGSLDPAAFTSYLEVVEPGRGTTLGFCTMNEPMNYPDSWWRSLTGLTYKMSQAGWNPDDLNQSSIQILRDPGWLFKWVGSLTFCVGVFCLFYGRSPSPNQSS